ncbi:MAG: hypothetical protein EWM72_00598 [Nitrospira sp.]|nr:MAG: hypothetical protein EWM72_00598 [Nitrospira sp.]
MARYATTFEEHVEILSTESPHALILDWWRRLSLAMDEYLKARGLPLKSKEEALTADPHVGPDVAARIRELRRLRNTIAHEETKPISPDEAAHYARKALDFIWLFAT